MGIILVYIIYVFLQNNWLEVERIEVKIDGLPKELAGFKIAQIADVHMPTTGSNLNKLIDKLEREKPDLIVLTGDLIDKRAKIDNLLLGDFCQDLTKIAETYAVTGNHELWNNTAKWKRILQENNVKIVEDNIVIYHKNNRTLAIMGLKDNCSYAEEKFNNIDRVKNIPRILLAHRPELFNTYCSDSYNIKPDLVLSGHAHGGQFRIPFLQIGVFAPNQGLFPKYTSGLYASPSGVQMIVSRGLGNSIIPVRINNRPHLPIITLK